MEDRGCLEYWSNIGWLVRLLVQWFQGNISPNGERLDSNAVEVLVAVVFNCWNSKPPLLKCFLPPYEDSILTKGSSEKKTFFALIALIALIFLGFFSSCFLFLCCTLSEDK